MKQTRHIIIIILIASLIGISCSTTKLTKIDHKSEQAFLEWWNSPHFKEAAFLYYDSWTIVADSRKLEAPNDILNGTEKIFSVHPWNDSELLLVMSQDNLKCDDQRAWLVLLPENIWILLDSSLSRQLCPHSKEFKYSDFTGSSINLYWCSNSKHPIIEILTNGPACTSHFMYVWYPEKNAYKLYGKKCD